MDYDAVRSLLTTLEGEEHLEYEKKLVFSTGLSIDLLIFDFDYYVYDAPSKIARPRPIPLDPAIHKAVLESFSHFETPVSTEDVEEENEEQHMCHAVDREADLDFEDCAQLAEQDHQHAEKEHQHLEQNTAAQSEQPAEHHHCQHLEDTLDVELAQAPAVEPALKPSGTLTTQPEGSSTKSEFSDALFLSVLHQVMRNDRLSHYGQYKAAIARRFPLFAFPDLYGKCDDDDLTQEELNVRKRCRRYRFCGSQLDNAICTHFLKYRPYMEDLKHYFRPDFINAGSIHDVFTRQHKHFLALRRNIRKRDREYVKLARKQTKQKQADEALKYKKKLAKTSPVRLQCQLRRSTRLRKLP